MLAAAGLALATGCTLAARLWWLFDLFSHFRLQYVVAAATLGVVALATHAWPTAAVLALVALLHGFAIKDLWLGRTPAAAAGGGVPLRVLSFNVLAHNLTPDAVFQFVRASDADLVVLVDAKRWRWRQVVSDLGRPYPYHAPLRWPQPPPVFVFSRFPIVSVDLVADEKTSPRAPRSCLLVEIAVGGQRLVIAGVHSTWPGLSASGHHRRQRELERLAAIVRTIDRPVIVAGDLNCTPWSPRFRDLVGAAGLRNAADGQGYIATWPQWFWPAQIPIDHVLLKGSLAVLRLRRGPALGSDHYPLIADLCLRSSP
jgi:endonuclease/exonuclease/phosphatase (EEP) superfamily protein YafD